MEQVLFYLVSGIALLSAGYFVFAKNPLYSILSLVVTFFSIAGIYVLLNAQFLGIIQVIVYAGAIMVLFLYILMMLNLEKGFNYGLVVGKDVAGDVGLTKNLGKLLFNDYVLPFELASILILAGIVGAVLIGKKDL